MNDFTCVGMCRDFCLIFPTSQKSQVMQAVKPHILVVELCVNRARIMQMDEETIMKEAADFSIGINFDNTVRCSLLFSNLQLLQFFKIT